jgi:hypothetical protein
MKKPLTADEYVSRHKRSIKKKEKVGADDVLVIGKAYFVRTVTYHQIGILSAIIEIGSFVGLVLTEAVWCADSGRFTQACQNGTLSEVELFSRNGPILVNLNAISDVSPWDHEVPKAQK